MRKKLVLVTALMLACILLLAGCDKKRETVTIDKFQKVCTTESMEEIDVSDFTSDFSGVSEVYGAKQVSSDLTGIYVSFTDAASAADAYQMIYDTLDPGSAGTLISMDGDNYRSCTLDRDGSYIRVIQVDEMLIRISASQTYKTEIDKIITNFGSYPVSAI